MPTKRDANERFDEKIERMESGCWMWRGALFRSGYGCFSNAEGRNTRAHRFAYARVNGQIPIGLVIAHRCDTPACVNPEHLWACPQSENLADMDAKGRRRPGRRPLRDLCKHGHAMTPENVRVVHPSGGKPFRQCRECEKRYERERYERKRTASVAA